MIYFVIQFDVRCRRYIVHEVDGLVYKFGDFTHTPDEIVFDNFPEAHTLAYRLNTELCNSHALTL